MNKKAAFGYFGIVQKNEVWSWSGIKEDESLVAMTIWTDQFKCIEENDSLFWSTYDQNNSEWIDSFGNKERIDIIKKCRQKLDGKFRPIFVEPLNPGVNDETRVITSTHTPNDDYWFKIVQFNEETGECAAIGYKK